EDDHIEARLARRRQRLEGQRAAIDGDHKAHPLLPELEEGRNVRAVALDQAVGDIGAKIRAHGGEEAAEDGGGGRPVHVIVAEDRDLLAVADGGGDAFRRPVHVAENVRIGHEGAEAGGEIVRRPLDIDAAPGKQPGHHVREPVSLHERGDYPLRRGAEAPGPSRERSGDPEDAVCRAESRQFAQTRPPSVASPPPVHDQFWSMQCWPLIQRTVRERDRITTGWVVYWREPGIILTPSSMKPSVTP